jgi:hypothetical protein
MGLAFCVSLAFFPSFRRMVTSLLAWTLFLFATRHFVPFARTWLIFLPIFFMGASAAVAALVHRLGLKRELIETLSAVILAIVLTIPVLRSESPRTSTETGVLRSASQIAAFLAAENIPPDRVFRRSTSDLPLQYYWWRRTGARPANPDLADLQQQGITEGWVLLNGAYGETIETFSSKYGLQNVRVLEEKPFDGAALDHIAWSSRQE